MASFEQKVYISNTQVYLSFILLHIVAWISAKAQ